MELKETLFTKSFSTEHDDPYSLAMDFMKKLAGHYKVYERKNIFETDGPVKKSTLFFDVVEPLDQFSSIRLNFSLVGENNTLYVDVTGYFVLKVEDYGFFTEIFTEFYLKSLFPGMKKASQQHIKRLSAEIDSL